MQLLVLNGSPKGKDSSTNILLDRFLTGFTETPGNSYEIVYLNQVNHHDECKEKFKEAEQVLLAFPLYTDAMPAIVKTFIETLQDIDADPEKSIGYIVHSGFSEAIHSRYVEKYLEKLTARLGCRYTGTIIRAGSNGIKDAPSMMTKGIYKSFHDLGVLYGAKGAFDPKLVHSLAKIETFSLTWRILLILMDKMGLINAGWNSMLKKNGGYRNRWARPYTE